MPALDIIDPATNAPVALGPRPAPALPEEGTVTHWFPALRYGLIAPADGSEEVFVPAVALRDAGVRALQPGQRVQYTRLPSVVDPERWQATRLALQFPFLGPAVALPDREAPATAGRRALLFRGVGEDVTAADVVTLLQPLATGVRVVLKHGLQALAYVNHDSDVDAVLAAFPAGTVQVNGQRIFLIAVDAPEGAADATASASVEPPTSRCSPGLEPQTAEPLPPAAVSGDVPLLAPTAQTLEAGAKAPATPSPATPLEELRRLLPRHSDPLLRTALRDHGAVEAAAAFLLAEEEKVVTLQQVFPASAGHTPEQLRHALRQHSGDVAAAAAALLDGPRGGAGRGAGGPPRRGWQMFTKSSGKPSAEEPKAAAERPGTGGGAPAKRSPNVSPKHPAASGDVSYAVVVRTAHPSNQNPRRCRTPPFDNRPLDVLKKAAGEGEDEPLRQLRRRWEWVAAAVLEAVLAAAEGQADVAEVLLSEVYTESLAHQGGPEDPGDPEADPGSLPGEGLGVAEASDLPCGGEGDCRISGCQHDGPRPYWRHRKEASRLDRASRRLLRRAAVAYAERDPVAAHRLAEEARAIQQRARRLHAEAAERIEKDVNAVSSGQPKADLAGTPWQLDLHGLYVEEAIAALDRRLRSLQGGPAPEGKAMATLTVVVGRGTHSPNGQPCIPNAVQAYLMAEGYLFKAGKVGCIEVRPK